MANPIVSMLSGEPSETNSTLKIQEMYYCTAQYNNFDNLIKRFLTTGNTQTAITGPPDAALTGDENNVKRAMRDTLNRTRNLILGTLHLI